MGRRARLAQILEMYANCTEFWIMTSLRPPLTLSIPKSSGVFVGVHYYSDLFELENV